MIQISENPVSISGNKRFVQFNGIFQDDLAKQIEFRYTAFTFGETNSENEPVWASEIVRLRKTDRLLATNDTKVNSQGVITPDGEFGEYDFYVSAIFSGAFTQQTLIQAVVERADENNRFD